MPYFSDVCGDLVKKEGPEDRHECLVCGTHALLYNRDKGVWYCFTCGIGGRVESRSAPLRDPNYRKTSVSMIPEPSVKTNGYIIGSEEYYTALGDSFGYDRNDIASAPYGEIRGISSQILTLCGAGQTQNSVIFPFFDLSGNLVGMQRYYHGDNPAGESRYRTCGEKGLLVLYSEQSSGQEESFDCMDAWMPRTKAIFLYEGIWDMLSCFQGLRRGSSINAGPWFDGAALPVLQAHIYLAGNCPTAKQRTLLVEFIRQCENRGGLLPKIFIAFDNDRASPPARLWHFLKLLVPNEIRIFQPPVGLVPRCKDWDEVANSHPEILESLFLTALTGYEK